MLLNKNVCPLLLWGMGLAYLVGGSSAIVVASMAEPMKICQDEEVDEMKLMQQIDQLQQQLESPDITLRDEAEQKLLQLGPNVLDYLEFSDQHSTDAKARIGRIRLQLEKLAVLRFTQPSQVSLQGKYPLADAIEEIRKQTGNQIQLSQRISDQLAELPLELDLPESTFWEATNHIMQAAGLAVDSYAGSANQLHLRPALPFSSQPQVENKEPDPRLTKIPRSAAGVFDVSVNRVVSVLDYANPGGSSTQISMAIRWEPRLQPISVDIPFRSLVIKDIQGNIVPIDNPDRVFHGVVSPEIPELEFNLPIYVNREIKELQSIEAEMTAVMPGRMETFRFRKIGTLTEGVQLQKAGATLVFENVRKNQDLYGVAVTLKFDETFNALESHQGWVYDNPIYLEDDEGNRMEPLTLEGVRQSENAVTIRYYFRDDPQDYSLVYKTVAAIIQHPVKFRIENVILP